MLQLVMKLLRNKDSDIFIATGCRRCWFEDSDKEVFGYIKSNQGTLRGCKPRTFDFAKMHTSLPHDKNINNVQSAVTEAL